MIRWHKNLVWSVIQTVVMWKSWISGSIKACHFVFVTRARLAQSVEKARICPLTITRDQQTSKTMLYRTHHFAYKGTITLCVHKPPFLFFISIVLPQDFSGWLTPFRTTQIHLRYLYSNTTKKNSWTINIILQKMNAQFTLCVHKPLFLFFDERKSCISIVLPQTSLDDQLTSEQHKFIREVSIALLQKKLLKYIFAYIDCANFFFSTTAKNPAIQHFHCATTYFPRWLIHVRTTQIHWRSFHIDTQKTLYHKHNFADNDFSNHTLCSENRVVFLLLKNS